VKLQDRGVRKSHEPSKIAEGKKSAKTGFARKGISSTPAREKKKGKERERRHQLTSSRPAIRGKRRMVAGSDPFIVKERGEKKGKLLRSKSHTEKKEMQRRALNTLLLGERV